jgi:EpsI family protein
MGELATINELRQFAIVGLIQVAIAAMLGPRVYRQIWFPALYLFFLVPAGQYLIGPMQRFATIFVDMCLNLIAIPHHTEGTLIELTNGRFEIAEACAGLRFLIATVALGVLFAYMMFRMWYKVALFLFACVAVPLIGNGLRVVGIILLAHFTSNEYGVGADHLVYGWGFNVAILLLLFLVGSLFRDSHDSETDIVVDDRKTDTLRTVSAVFLAAALLISSGPALARWQESRVITPHVSGLLRPMNIPGWRVAESMDDWQPTYPDADAHLSMSLARIGGPPRPAVDLHVVYYARARGAHALTAHINRLWNGEIWTAIGSGSAVARVHGQDIQLQEWVISSPAERRIIWASYWINGRFTTSPLTVKFLQIPAALQGREGQAIVAVSTGVDGPDDEARIRLSAAMMALQDLPSRLNSVNSGGSSSN